MGKWAIVFSLITLALIAGCDNTGDPAEASFTLTIEVLSGSVTPLAPVAWAVHSGNNPFFTQNTTTRIDGLEALAEDGDPSTAAASLASLNSVMTSGAADTPVGAGGPGPATPGASYSFTFTAIEGDMLSFATMYVQSNDLFFSPGETGISLFPGGDPITGNITAQLFLFDAGTEVNEQPGVGANQAPRQAAPNTGPDENGTVQIISDVLDGFTYPAVDEVISVTISAGS
jgi:hypothetical protein